MMIHIRQTKRIFNKHIIKIYQSRYASADSPSKYCFDLVRQFDYENCMAAVLLKNPVRSGAFAVRAFNVNLARVQDQVTDPKIGLMRLQFWSDTLDKIYSKEPCKIPENPVALELNEVVKRTKIPKQFLLRLLNVRRNNISKKYFVSVDEMEKYSEESVSPVYYAILEIAGIKNVHCDHAASHLGKAQGLTNMLRSVEVCASQRIVMLPTDLLMKHNVSQESVLRLTESQNLKDVVYNIASIANNHLTKARSIKVNSECKKIFLPAVAVDSYLQRLQKCDFNLFNNQLKMRNSLLPLLYYWNKIKSTY